MIQLAAFAIVLLTGLYFAFLGITALARPKLASEFLLGFASTPIKHYSELLVRLLVGASFVALAQSVLYPLLFQIFGWVLIGTTFIMLFLPWKTHSRIAQSSVHKAGAYLPVIGVASLFFGGFVIFALLRGYAA